VLSRRAANLIQRSLFALVAAALCGALLNSFTIDTLHWRHLWLLLALGWMPLWPLRSRRRSEACETQQLANCKARTLKKAEASA
jgi:predicted membrane channel-forming protein YqfA (hemolysin III family)